MLPVARDSNRKFPFKQLRQNNHRRVPNGSNTGGEHHSCGGYVVRSNDGKRIVSREKTITRAKRVSDILKDGLAVAEAQRLAAEDCKTAWAECKFDEQELARCYLEGYASSPNPRGHTLDQWVSNQLLLLRLPDKVAEHFGKTIELKMHDKTGKPVPLKKLVAPLKPVAPISNKVAGLNARWRKVEVNHAGRGDQHVQSQKMICAVESDKVEIALSSPLIPYDNFKLSQFTVSVKPQFNAVVEQKEIRNTIVPTVPVASVITLQDSVVVPVLDRKGLPDDIVTPIIIPVSSPLLKLPEIGEPDVDPYCKFCMKCGKHRWSDAKFCIHCGSSMWLTNFVLEFHESTDAKMWRDNDGPPTEVMSDTEPILPIWFDCAYSISDDTIPPPVGPFPIDPEDEMVIVMNKVAPTLMGVFGFDYEIRTRHGIYDYVVRHKVTNIELELPNPIDNRPHSHTRVDLLSKDTDIMLVTMEQDTHYRFLGTCEYKDKAKIVTTLRVSRETAVNAVNKCCQLMEDKVIDMKLENFINAHATSNVDRNDILVRDHTFIYCSHVMQFKKYTARHSPFQRPQTGVISSSMDTVLKKSVSHKFPWLPVISSLAMLSLILYVIVGLLDSVWGYMWTGLVMSGVTLIISVILLLLLANVLLRCRRRSTRVSERTSVSSWIPGYANTSAPYLRAMSLALKNGLRELVILKGAVTNYAKSTMNSSPLEEV